VMSKNSLTWLKHMSIKTFSDMCIKKFSVWLCW
jgi:hypothetical protein